MNPVRHLAWIAAALVTLLCSCAGSSGPSLTWTCSVTTGGTGTGAWDFTATVTAHNAGTAPVTVDGYTVVIYDAAGQEIFSGDWVLNGTVEPGQSLSGSYERGSVLNQAPATCKVPSWTS